MGHGFISMRIIVRILLMFVAQSSRHYVYQISSDVNIHIISAKVKICPINWAFKYQACLRNSKQSSAVRGCEGFVLFSNALENLSLKPFHPFFFFFG